MNKAVHLSQNDTVAVTLENMQAGDVIDSLGIKCRDDIPKGHKVALTDHKPGDAVIKYGDVIGTATRPIGTGEHVHSHNTKTTLVGASDYVYSGPPTEPTKTQPAPVMNAYLRANGDIGIRNDLWVVPLVGCVNGLAESIARRFMETRQLPEGNRAIALTHPYGCSQLGDDLANTRGILQNLVVHPNAGGVLVLALGCENNTLDYFKDGLVLADPSRVRFLVGQEVDDEIDGAMAALSEIAAIMAADIRQPVGVDRLRVGLKCGGSDGFSGITGNPLLGAFSDWICAVGGTSVLTEVPEMFGAEHLLLARAKNEDIFQRTVSLVNDFKQYFLDNKQPIYENPSPGNKAGGITTLEEKALGCTQKAGSSIVCDVLRYTERLRTTGLNLLESPGNDAVSTTALAACGCHMVLFTTGRGTPLGGIVPTVKVATNSDLARRKKHWTDFDAGPIATGEQSIAEMNASFVEVVLAVAEGRPTRNEENGLQDIAIFKTGVTL